MCILASSNYFSRWQPKEVYCEAIVVDNESHEVSQMEYKCQDTITKQKSEAKDQNKTSGIWTYFQIDSTEISKRFVLPARRKFHGEEVSQLNLIPATFVSI